jgi:hypothetical protein
MQFSPFKHLLNQMENQQFRRLWTNTEILIGNLRAFKLLVSLIYQLKYCFTNFL